MILAKLVSIVLLFVVLAASEAMVATRYTKEVCKRDGVFSEQVKWPLLLKYWYGLVGLYFVIAMVGISSNLGLLKFIALILVFCVIQTYVWYRLINFWVSRDKLFHK